MSRADLIAPHLPYLRRYARALTGTQEAGDQYVMGTLQALVEDPDINLIGPDPRIGLYRTFTAIWQSLEVNLEPSSSQTAGERNLKRITPLPRQAFLLTSVEGFSAEQAAIVLDLKEEEVSSLIKQAGQEIADQVGTNVLIIEDEPLIAMDIDQIVRSLGHSVDGIARTEEEALDLVRRTKPGLILADIQLADGSSGIDAVNHILETVNVPVIFITAFPERLLTGDRPEPAFLVTKPFQPDMVGALISQALFFETNAGG